MTAASVEVIPQPHGGALAKHGFPGNRGGIGRVPTIVRAMCLQDFDRRRRVLREVADGEPTERMRVPIASIAKHLQCSSCAAPMVPTDDAKDVEIRVKVSAPARDRVKAVDTLGKYSGLASETKITIVSPDVQDRVTRTVEAVMRYPGLDDATREGLLDAIEEAWA